MDPKKFIMKDIPVSERPYEILERKGASALTDAQLLSVILSTGTKEETALGLSTRLLSEAGSKGNALSEFFGASYAYLSSRRGIGRVKALQIMAVSEIARRLKSGGGEAAVYLNDPAAAAQYGSRFIGKLNQETVLAFYLNVKNRLLFEKEISRGNINRSLLSPREVFEPALERGAARIILAHNHPSGDPTPSANDLTLSEKLCACGDLMEIPILDHIILGDDSFYSLKEHGKM